MPDRASGVQVEPGAIDPAVWRIAVVVVLGSLLSVLDTTIVNIALDSLARDLHTSLDNIQWVATAYLLSLAAVIPVTGWAARRFGARRIFLVSVVTFTVGSALCGLASSPGELIAFRAFQGVGGGMILPIGQMILVKKAGPANMARVMSAIGVPVIMAPVIGPTIGGLLLDHAGWRWIFYVNLPVGVAAVVAALRLLPHDPREEAGPLDFTGLVIVAPGLVGITYGLAEIGAAGSFTAARALIPLIAGVVLVGLFVWRAHHVEHPLLDLHLYRSPAFSAASLTTFALGAALFGGMILLPLYFQGVRHLDAVTTGLLLMPQGLGTATSMWLSGRLTDRIGAGITALIGGCFTTVATVPFMLIGAHTPYYAIDLFMVARGFGIGLAVMPAMTAAFRTLQPGQANDAAPQLNAVQRIGGSIGVALLTVVLQQHLNAAGASTGRQADSFAVTFAWVVAVTILSVIPTLLLTRIERRAATLAATGAGAARARGTPMRPVVTVEADGEVIAAPEPL